MARFNPKTIGPDHKPTSSGEVEDCNGEDLMTTENGDVATSPQPAPKDVREAWSPRGPSERTLSEVDISTH